MEVDINPQQKSASQLLLYSFKFKVHAKYVRRKAPAKRLGFGLSAKQARAEATIKPLSRHGLALGLRPGRKGTHSTYSQTCVTTLLTALSLQILSF